MQMIFEACPLKFPQYKAVAAATAAVTTNNQCGTDFKNEQRCLSFFFTIIFVLELEIPQAKLL